MLEIVGGVLSLNEIHHDADHHVEKHESSKEDEAQIIDPAQGVDGHGFVHDVGPVLERDHTEQGEH